MKTLEAVSPTCGPTATIAPTLDAFHEAFDIEGNSVSVTVRIPTQLRSLSGNAAEVQVEAGTVAEALKALDGAHPGFDERLFDESGALRRFVNVFLADEDIRFLQGIDTPVTEGQVVSIVPAVAGG